MSDRAPDPRRPVPDGESSAHRPGVSPNRAGVSPRRPGVSPHRPEWNPVGLRELLGPLAALARRAGQAALTGSLVVVGAVLLGLQHAAPALRRAWRSTLPATERLDERLGPAIRATISRMAAAGRRAVDRISDRAAGLGRTNRGRDRAAATAPMARASGPPTTEESDRPRWQPVAAVLVAVPLAGLVLGLVGAPTVTLAAQAVTGVQESLLQAPPLPEVAEPGERSILYAADGTRMGLLVGSENRVLVGLDKISEVMQNAAIATEDTEFWEHDGLNLQATTRALIRNVASGRVEEGGSTITQQYVKNALLTPEQTLSRKVKEALFAIELEEQLTKEEILEGYLNLSYFSNGSYGVEAAAQRYFDKRASELELPEAALLAGMIRAPQATDPLDRPEAAKQRQQVVLRQMVAEGYATQEEADAAAAIPLDELLSPTSPPPPRFPFFVEYLKQQLLQEPALGETREERVEAMFNGGLRIHTTIDEHMQVTARDAIRERLSDPAADPMAGLITVEPNTGAIRAMAVGPDQFGVCEEIAEGEGPTDEDGEDTVEATPAECTSTKVNPLAPGMGGSGRQVGSAFKPILDTAALDSGISTDWSTSTDSGAEVDGCVDYIDGRKETWTPENYSGTGGGTLDMPDAIRLSNNVYHAKLIAEIGPATAVEMAHKLGIDTEIPEACAIALGAASVFPIDMVEAFGTLANDGVRCTPFAITKITDTHGETIVEYEPDCERVVDEEVAQTMVTMMREVVRRGTATRARVAGWDLAGKTGTTNDFKDAWFVGFGKPLVTASWVGFELPEPMLGVLGHRRITGGSVPAEIWHAYMSQILPRFEPEPLPRVGLERYTPPPPPPSSDDDGNGNAENDDGENGNGDGGNGDGGNGDGGNGDGGNDDGGNGNGNGNGGDDD